MELYLLRHADALTKEESGVKEDIDRPLSVTGEKEAALIGEFIKRAKFLFEKVYVSPARRARQTAEIALTPSSQQNKISQQNALYGSMDAILTFLADIYPAPSVLLVGHDPAFSQLVDYLIFGRKLQGADILKIPVKITKASFAKLTLEPEDIDTCKTLEAKINALAASAKVEFIITQPLLASILHNL